MEITLTFTEEEVGSLYGAIRQKRRKIERELTKSRKPEHIATNLVKLTRYRLLETKLTSAIEMPTEVE